MKNTLFLISFLLVGVVDAKQITLNIPDDEIKIVENDVMDAEEWIRQAWGSKVARCKERLIKQEVDQSMKASEALPAGEEAVVQKALKRPGYESRKQREARFAKQAADELKAANAKEK